MRLRRSYRAVAVNVLGYGRSAKPAATHEYHMLDHVEDSVALVRALGEYRALTVGFD
ncbi:alpha/beta fold hydrolase [Streptomyces sp. NPDC005890]|uniref:alpha/beta fold hydrolase n=1 Tax=Streptomyces sp. NPDC005890 TaxID=3154568 RepID=UPI0033C3259D